jgi:uncharacterized protein
MNHLVIFAKAPRLGRVKSRLAKGIGVVPAWQFYRQNLKRIVNRMSANARWTTWLAVTPDKSSLLMGKVRMIDQGTGDLGARMGRVMTTLPSGPVVIVGTDIPDIQQTDIRQAFRRLGSYDAVLGPATDGGYWLVGLKRTPSIPRIFEDVRWSSPHALSDTLANLDRQALKVHMLRELEDVDDEQSYERWKST